MKLKSRFASVFEDFWWDCVCRVLFLKLTRWLMRNFDHFTPLAIFYVKKNWEFKFKNLKMEQNNLKFHLSRNWFSGESFVIFLSSRADSAANHSRTCFQPESVWVFVLLSELMFLFQRLKISKLRLHPKVFFLRGLMVKSRPLCGDFKIW